MIKHLPRGSRYVSLMTWRARNGKGEDKPEMPEALAKLRDQQEQVQEIREWSDLTHELNAAQVNLLNDLLRYAPQWKKTPPEAERVGPSWWKTASKEPKKKRWSAQGESTSHATPKQKPSGVFAAMQAMGFDGPAPT